MPEDPVTDVRVSIPLRALFFEGGSERRHYAWFSDESVQEEAEEVWSFVRQDYPRLLPNLEGQGDFLAFEATGCSLLWSDVPLARSGLRLFTVCYAVRLGRVFWNVFSFAYAADDTTIPLVRRLMTYSPESLRRLAQSHDEDSRELRLVSGASLLQEDREVVGEWDACGAWVSHFPVPGKPRALLDGRVTEPWRMTLSERETTPASSDEVEPAEEQRSPNVEPKNHKLKPYMKYLVAALLLFTCAGLLWATPMGLSQKPVWKLEQEITANIPNGMWEGPNHSEYREPLEELLKRDTKAAAESMRKCMVALKGTKVQNDIPRLEARANEIEQGYNSEKQRVEQMPLRELRPYILKHEWLSDEHPGDDAKYRYGLAALMESIAPSAAGECRQCAEGIRIHDKDKNALLERAQWLENFWLRIKLGAGGVLLLSLFTFIFYIFRIQRAQRL